MTNQGDRRYGDEYGPADYLSNNGRSACREHDLCAAYDAAMPYRAVPHLKAPYPVANIPAGYGSGHPTNYSVSSFSELNANSKVAPLAVQMTVYLDSDPNLANGSVARRGGVLLMDSVIYIALITTLAVLSSIAGSSDSGVMVLLLNLLLDPGGFYLYRVTGDSIFDGSPGKYAMDMKIEGAHGMPASTRDGFVHNAWILPPMIPIAGWFVFAGLAGWIAMGASRDPLGRGRHELSVRTRMVEKPETHEFQRRQCYVDNRMGSKEPQPKQLKRTKRVKRGKQSGQGERGRAET